MNRVWGLMISVILVLEPEMSLPINAYKDVHSDREVYRLRSFISSSMQQMKKIVFDVDGRLPTLTP